MSAAIEWLAANEPRLPDVGPTPFTLAMPILYQGPDPFVSYRSYYLADKQGYWHKSKTKSGVRLRWVPARWTGRDPPPWWSWAPIPTRPTSAQMINLKVSDQDLRDGRCEIVLPPVTDLQPLAR